VRGNVKVSSGTVCIINATVTGDVTQHGGSLITGNSSIRGDLQIFGASAFSIDAATTIDGGALIQSLPASGASNQICGTHVRGSVRIRNNGAGVEIGSTTPACGGNAVGGNLRIDNNSAPVQVFDNSVRGGLLCRGNLDITGGGNNVFPKRGQCSSF